MALCDIFIYDMDNARRMTARLGRVPEEIE
jgi:hypothetical protein